MAGLVPKFYCLALNLAAPRLRHIAGTAWSTKRYLKIELLKDQLPF
jgi:hypothetical protein